MPATLMLENEGFDADIASVAFYTSEMLRGNRQPPAYMDHYPKAYASHSYAIERHLPGICDIIGDRTDQEMEEIYSMLRRRPDGKSLGACHDVLWQVAALLLGCIPTSEAEFEAVFETLTRSARGWAIQPISRNYVEFLRKSSGEPGPTEWPVR
jgi:hypothetical protein